MTKHNPEAGILIDEYISSMPLFAQQICITLRGIILNSYPGIFEDWKWGPNYQKEGMLCGFGAFKKHVNLVFFKGSLMSDPKKIFEKGTAAISTRSIKFSSVDEIDEKIITMYVRQAVKINLSGRKPERPQLAIHPEMKKVLSKNKAAKTIFDKLSYTHQKEYVLWINDARKDETRERRLGRLTEMLLSGKKEP